MGGKGEPLAHGARTSAHPLDPRLILKLGTVLRGKFLEKSSITEKNRSSDTYDLCDLDTVNKTYQ